MARKVPDPVYRRDPAAVATLERVVGAFATDLPRGAGARGRSGHLTRR